MQGSNVRAAARPSGLQRKRHDRCRAAVREHLIGERRRKVRARQCRHRAGGLRRDGAQNAIMSRLLALSTLGDVTASLMALQTVCKSASVRIIGPSFPLLVVEIQRKVPHARGLRRCSPEFGFWARSSRSDTIVTLGL